VLAGLLQALEFPADYIQLAPPLFTLGGVQ
jgi:hypothetical protein